MVVHDNLSLGDREHGVMLNFANNADVRGNLVRGGTQEMHLHLQRPQEPDRRQPLRGLRHRHPLHRRIGAQRADRQRLHRQPRRR
jgi:hypothetical protein